MSEGQRGPTTEFYLVSDATGVVFLAPGDLKIVGRDEASDIVLLDLQVSRRHARLFWDGDGFVLEDLNSRNGTFRQGERISVIRLEDGDTFRVGPYNFTLRKGRPVEDLLDSDTSGIMETVAGVVSQGLNYCDTGFNGDLSTLGIPELIQTLHQGCKTGVLVISRQDMKARLYFEDGEIVHARAGILMDRDALFRVIHLREGTFEFNDCVEPPARTIDEGTMALLLEAFRRADEESRV